MNPDDDATRPPPEPRRAAVAWVSPEVLVALLLGAARGGVRLPVFKDLPWDVVVEDACHDWNRGAFGLRLSHPSFAVVPDGCPCPWLEPEVVGFVVARPAALSFRELAEDIVDSNPEAVRRLAVERERKFLASLTEATAAPAGLFDGTTARIEAVFHPSAAEMERAVREHGTDADRERLDAMDRRRAATFADLTAALDRVMDRAAATSSAAAIRKNDPPASGPVVMPEVP